MYTRRLRSMSSNEIGKFSGGSGSRKYACNDCNRTFALKASLLRHKTLYECNRGRQPYERQSPHEEERSHNERKSKKEHVCFRCKRVYAFFTSLWRHQKYECGVEPKFVCSICKNRFAQKSNLERHVRSKHWIVNSLIVTARIRMLRHDKFNTRCVSYSELSVCIVSIGSFGRDGLWKTLLSVILTK